MRTSLTHLIIVMFVISTLGAVFITELDQAAAQSGTATITTHDEYYVNTSTFKTGNYVYFSIHAEDEFGNNITSSVYLYVYRDTNIIEYTYVSMDSSGNGEGSFLLDSAYSAGIYTLEVKDTYGGTTIGTAFITVYEPTYTATVRTYDFYYDQDGVPTNLFTIGENVYYFVQVKDEEDVPLKYTYIYVQFYDPYNSQLDYDYIWLNGTGICDSYFTTGYSFEPGEYTIKVRLSMSGTIIGSKVFTLETLILTATVTTWDKSPEYNEDAQLKKVFNENDRVYFHVHVEDQRYRPADYVYLNIYLMFEGEYLLYRSLSTDYNGNLTSYFRLYDLSDIQFGMYTIEVQISDTDEVIGSDYIYVMELTITFDKNLYSPEEEMEVTINFRPYNLFPHININLINSETKSLVKKWSQMKVSSDGVLIIKYTLPSGLSDGDYNITIYDNNNNFLGENTFPIQLYSLIIYSECRTYLPGDSIKVYYSLTNRKDGSSIDTANYEWHFRYPQYVYYCPFYWLHNDTESSKVSKDATTCSEGHTFEYPNEGIEYKTKHGHFKSTSSMDTFSFNIPDNVLTGETQIRVWANATDGKHSGYASHYVYIGSANVNVYTDLDEYAPGDFVVVSVSAFVEYMYYYSPSPLSDASVTLTFFKYNTDALKYEQLSQYSVADMITDANGRCEYMLILGDELEEGTYRINVTISKSNVEIDPEDAKDSTTITIGERKPQMKIDLKFDQTSYEPGDTVKVDYEIAYMDSGEGVTDTIIDYYVYTSYDVYVAIGRFNSEDATGSFEFDIPDNFDGYLYINVKVTDEEGETTSQIKSIKVIYANLILNVDKMYYDPGDSISVDYELENHIGAIDFYYKVTYTSQSYNDGLFLEEHFESSKPKGSFNFTIPTVGVAESYEIQMYSIDSDGHYSDGYLEIYRKSDYVLTVSLDKDKYARGQEIIISYEIVAQGDDPLPEYIVMKAMIMGSYETRYVTNEPKGNFTYLIPGNASIGQVLFYVNALDSDRYSSYHTIEIVETPADLEPPTTGEDEEKLTEAIAETLGVSLFDIILIIIVVLILVVVYLQMRRSKPRGDEEKEKDKKGEEDKGEPAKAGLFGKGKKKPKKPKKAKAKPAEDTTEFLPAQPADYDMEPPPPPPTTPPGPHSPPPPPPQYGAPGGEPYYDSQPVEWTEPPPPPHQQHAPPPPPPPPTYGRPPQRRPPPNQYY
ncbi:MAG: hypothetical protein JSV49_07410 [Thermoplasmata archaeon]|nr:MAG: hypothetical protein JSV49_07410 [Thermoplasmata archaeon]